MHDFVRGVVTPDGAGEASAPSVFGPSEHTRRDLRDEFRWEGLSAGDVATLARFLEALEHSPDELHTHIPVGGVVRVPADCATDGMQRMADWLYPRRVDAALRFGDAWWIVECKTSRGLAGLGQLMGYYYWWCRDCPECEVTRLVLACQGCDEDEAEAYAAAGVDVAVV